jgi:hypothetical protein
VGARFSGIGVGSMKPTGLLRRAEVVAGRVEVVTTRAGVIPKREPIVLRRARVVPRGMREDEAVGPSRMAVRSLPRCADWLRAIFGDLIKSIKTNLLETD